MEQALGMENQSNSKKLFHNSSLIIFTLLGLGAFLRFYQFERSLGGGDENAMLLYFGYHPFKYIVTSYFEASNHVFHTLLVHWMTVWFGEENAFAIRFPSLIFGMAGLWMIYKTAHLLFRCHHISRLALLIAAINPIHIYYSQTARGYILIMFFSAAMLYSAVKLLDAQPGLKWGAVIILCGFLSIYTLPTNVYFVLGLAGWLFFALTVPKFKREFDFPGGSATKKLLGFSAVFAAIGLLSLLAYWPLLEQMRQVAEYDIAFAQGIYESKDHSILGSLPKLISTTVFLILQGPLKWFLPFILVGILWGKTVRSNYRWIPVVVFFLPLVPTLFTDVSGYPRNYIYNLPLLIIFLAAGLVRTGYWLAETLPRWHMGTVGGCGLIVLYTFFSLKIFYFKHHPSIEVPDGESYKQKIKEYNDPLNLILIPDFKHYMYARLIVKENTENIINENKISGVKLIGNESFDFDNFKLMDGGGPFKVFNNLYSIDHIKGHDVTGSKKIFDLANTESVSLLPEDFDSKANWEITSGSGKLSNTKNFKIIGNHSLMVQANPSEVLSIEAPLPDEVNLLQDSLAVLFWCGSSRFPALIVRQMRLDFSAPNIHEKFVAFRNQKGTQLLRMGSINLRMGNRMAFESGNWNSQETTINILLGKIPAGRYQMSLGLTALPGESEVYDCLNLFFIKADVSEGMIKNH